MRASEGILRAHKMGREAWALAEPHRAIMVARWGSLFVRRGRCTSEAVYVGRETGRIIELERYATSMKNPQQKTELRNAWSTWLRATRESHRMSRARLSMATGITEGMLTAYELQGNLPRLGNLIRIVRFLGHPPWKVWEEMAYQERVHPPKSP